MDQPFHRSGPSRTTIGNGSHDASAASHCHRPPFDGDAWVAREARHAGARLHGPALQDNRSSAETWGRSSFMVLDYSSSSVFASQTTRAPTVGAKVMKDAAAGETLFKTLYQRGEVLEALSE